MAHAKRWLVWEQTAEIVSVVERSLAKRGRQPRSISPYGDKFVI